MEYTLKELLYVCCQRSVDKPLEALELSDEDDEQKLLDLHLFGLYLFNLHLFDLQLPEEVLTLT
jgi:hypothetical protein